MGGGEWGGEERGIRIEYSREAVRQRNTIKYGEKSKSTRGKFRTNEIR